MSDRECVLSDEDVQSYLPYFGMCTTETDYAGLVRDIAAKAAEVVRADAAFTLDRTRKERDDAEKQRDTLRSELAEARRYRDTLIRELTTLNDTIDTLRADLDQMRRERDDALSQNLSHICDAAVELRAENEAIRGFLRRDIAWLDRLTCTTDDCAHALQSACDETIRDTFQYIAEGARAALDGGEGEDGR